jgi:NAD(P)-dependent dehydrogenase (short-subunit alcohol dehydrogenase family)
VATTSSPTAGTRRWTAQDVGDLSGRTAVITGANAGIGLEIARVLAAHGAQPSVRAAAEISARYRRLDLLINNAGVMEPPYERTEDGFELTAARATGRA